MHKYLWSIMILGLLIVLVGCTQEKVETMAIEPPLHENLPKQECEDKGLLLEKKCNDQNIDPLSLADLEQCHWFSTDREYYLANCEKITLNNSYASAYLTQLLINKKKINMDTIFMEEIKERCDTTLIGQFTLREIKYCTSLVDFSFLSSLPWEEDDGEFYEE